MGQHYLTGYCKDGHTFFSTMISSEYQYHSIQEAADIISNVLNKINDDKNLYTVERNPEISNRVSKFLIQSYKTNLKNIIDDVIKSREVEKAVILNKTQTRIPERKEV